MKVNLVPTVGNIALEVARGQRKPPVGSEVQFVGIDLVAIGKRRPQAAEQQAKQHRYLAQFSPGYPALSECHTRSGCRFVHANDASYSQCALAFLRWPGNRSREP